MKWLVLMMIIPFASASILPTNCATAPVDHGECQNILSDTSLSLTEKEDLYLNLLNAQSELPSHDFVWNWNTQITFSQPPASIAPTNNGIIKNAWLKIVGVNKSVFDLNQQKWFVQPTGQIQTAKNYEIQMPSGTLPGECQTTYSNSITQNQFSVKANEQQIGTGTISNYSTDLPDQSDLNFKAEWNLTAQLSTSHYQNRQHSFFDGWQWHYWFTCDFISTTTDYYPIHLQDALPATVLVPQYAVQTAFDPQNQKQRLKIESNESLNRVKLSQNSKSFSLSQARYDLNQTLAPYGALYITRTPENQVKTNYLLTDKNENRFELATPTPENCELKITTDFEEENHDCNLIILKQTRIELNTDQNQFDQNETIQLHARLLDDQNNPLSNKIISFSTKNQNEGMITDNEGNAVWNVLASQSNGILTAQFASDSEFAQTKSTTRVPVAGNDLTPQAIDVTGFFAAYYFLFAIFKRKLGAF